MPNSKVEAQDEARRALGDPVAVHANMLRGVIAKPSIENIIHLYGRDALLTALRAEPVRAAEEKVVTLLREAEPTLSRSGHEIRLQCTDGSITDDLYAALENAICAIPIQSAAEGGEDA